MSNAPAKKYRIGLVTATIWKNEGTDKPYYTVQVQRQYKDAEGNWKGTDYFNHDDLLNCAELLKRCEAWIAAQ